MTSQFVPSTTAGDTISPAELLVDILTRLGPPDMTFVAGPATNAQQQEGVVSITDSGLPALEYYAPQVSSRAQLRCVGGSVARAEYMGRAMQAWFHEARPRIVGRMKSTDKRYLFHQMNVNAGPSLHFDSLETWESLLFVELRIGSEAL